ncbi:MAG: NAAT family transporter [Chitinivibrionales bacterium]|nr:NAAT family transporter [Chitinivibrionales bacterium]
MTTLSAAALLFLVLDPIGNIPFFISVLKKIEPKRQRIIILREMCIAFLILVIFLFTGQYILAFLVLSRVSLSISGGIILFLIALRMIFSDSREIFGASPEEEPFIFPLAVPFIAGPSAMATILLLMARNPQRWPQWLLALFSAWFLSLLILLISSNISKLVGLRTIAAIERLMGMLLTTVAVEMFLRGIQLLK